jgi:hypothetical protein
MKSCDAAPFSASSTAAVAIKLPQVHSQLLSCMFKTEQQLRVLGFISSPDANSTVVSALKVLMVTYNVRLGACAHLTAYYAVTDSPYANSTVVRAVLDAHGALKQPGV